MATHRGTRQARYPRFPYLKTPEVGQASRVEHILGAQ